jgi:hypothetical protein
MSKRPLKRSKRRSKAVIPALGTHRLVPLAGKRSNRRSDYEFTGDLTAS